MTKKPCRPDQFRNPETGRCKKIGTQKNPQPRTTKNPPPMTTKNPPPMTTKNPPPMTTETKKKTCRPDQFRNPKTGRCKKIPNYRPPFVVPIVPIPPAPVVIEPPTPIVIEPPTPVVIEPPTPIVIEPPTPIVIEPPTPIVIEPPTPIVIEPPTPVVIEPPTPIVIEPPAPVVIEPPTPIVIEPPTPPSPLERRPSRNLAQVSGAKESILLKSEICTGHILARLVGQRNVDLKKFVLGDLHHYASERWNVPLPKNIISKRGGLLLMAPFNTIAKVILGKKDYPPIMSGDAHNAEGHATVTNVSSRDGKNIKIWYHDPNGVAGSNDLNEESFKQFNKLFSNRPWFKDTEIRTATDFTLKQIINEQTPPEIPASWSLVYSIKRLLIFWRRSPRYNEILKDLNVWRSFDKKKFSSKLEDYDFMAALFIFTKLTDSTHCEIISPYVSMNEIGPQSTFGEGFCMRHGDRTERFLNRINDNVEATVDIGACVVWSDLYSMYVKAYHSRLNDNDLIAFLRENPFVGEISGDDVLGQMGWNKHSDTKMKNFMKEIYNMIPDESSIKCLDTNKTVKCPTKYHTDLLEIYDRVINHWIKYKVIKDDLIGLFVEKLIPDSFESTNRFIRFFEKSNYESKFVKMIDYAKNIMKKDEIIVFNFVLLIMVCKHRKFFT